MTSADITLLDETIPSFQYNGRNYYLADENFMRHIAEKLPWRVNVHHYEGDKVTPGTDHKEPATVEDVTEEDIKNYIVANLDDWREEDE